MHIKKEGQERIDKKSLSRLRHYVLEPSTSFYCNLICLIFSLAVFSKLLKYHFTVLLCEYRFNNMHYWNKNRFSNSNSAQSLQLYFASDKCESYKYREVCNLHTCIKACLKTLSIKYKLIEA